MTITATFPAVQKSFFPVFRTREVRADNFASLSLKGQKTVKSSAN